MPLYLFFSLFLVTNAQEEKKYKFYFQLDNRFSSIRDNNITILGFKTGTQYKNLTRFGIGASMMLNTLEINYFNKKLKQNESNTINFWYFSLFNDWFIYKKNKWEFIVTEQIGYGKPSFVKEVNDEIVTDLDIPLYVNELSTQINYKISSLLGVGVGIGYRNILNSSSRLKDTFEAPIYIARVNIFPEYFLKK